MANRLYSVLNRPRGQFARVHPDVSIAQCVQIMTSGDIGALVVMDEYNIMGIVSERDIVRNLVHKGLNANETKVGDILCARISILDINDTVEAAMQVITDTRRRHLLVAEEGNVVDILSIGDVLFYLLEDHKRTIEHLEQYIHGG